MLNATYNKKGTAIRGQFERRNGTRKEWNKERNKPNPNPMTPLWDEWFSLVSSKPQTSQSGFPYFVSTSHYLSIIRSLLPVSDHYHLLSKLLVNCRIRSTGCFSWCCILSAHIGWTTPKYFTYYRTKRPSPVSESPTLWKALLKSTNQENVGIAIVQ